MKRDRGEVGRSSDAQRLDHRQPGRGLEGVAVGGRPAAMQLQPVRPQRRGEFGSPRDLPIDDQRDDLRPAPGLGRESDRLLDRDEARAARMEVQADHARTGRERSLQRLGGREPADLHQDIGLSRRHGAAHSMIVRAVALAT